MTFFFCINQDLDDGSAHALYCLRHCRAMAAARPADRVVLLHAGRSDGAAADVGERPANLEIRRLRAVRRRKGGRGLTLNIVFYWALIRHLRRHLRDGDAVCVAGFLKLADRLFRPGCFARKIVRVYDSHQDMCLEHGADSAAAALETRVFSRAEVLLTTTEVMRASILRRIPGANCIRLGLGCGYSPAAFTPAPRREPGAEFTLGYVGSFYAGQGVEWLISAWRGLPPAVAARCRLTLVGGGADEVLRLRRWIASLGVAGVSVCGRVAPEALPGLVAGLDALVIPSLPEGRMPYVAITKAYDYLAMRRPLLVADLPSITEVVRPGREGVAFRAGDAADFVRAVCAMYASGNDAGPAADDAARRALEFDWVERARRVWAAVSAPQAWRAGA